ncbi:META domain-containing protein [Flavobacterium sp.]|uniref:META domain-containing protein n=1 Tax=Flavobacterium sp. TaxID=239 RepID=UPI003D6C4111
MKKYVLLLSVFLFMVLNSCTASKTAAAKNLYGATWELEYISGPRIAFEGLFPENKPQITFTENEKKINGTTSCNGYGTSFTIDGNTIKIEQPGAMTMRYCEGGGENVFLQTMEKINKFSIDNEHKLNLMIDNVPMMRFKKVN